MVDVPRSSPGAVPRMPTTKEKLDEMFDRVGIVPPNRAHSRLWQMTDDGRQVTMPTEVFRALLNAGGGCVVIDHSDLAAVIGPDVQITVTEYQDPWKLVFRFEELPEDPNT